MGLPAGARRSAARLGASRASPSRWSSMPRACARRALLCYEALWQRDRGEDPAVAREHGEMVGAAGRRRSRTRRALTFGHAGYSEELPLGQRVRDLIGLEIGDGTAQIAKLVVAGRLLGRESARDPGGSMDFVDYQHLRFERRDDGVLLITIDRPEADERDRRAAAHGADDGLARRRRRRHHARGGHDRRRPGVLGGRRPRHGRRLAGDDEPRRARWPARRPHWCST